MLLELINEVLVAAEWNWDGDPCADGGRRDLEVQERTMLAQRKPRECGVVGGGPDVAGGEAADKLASMLLSWRLPASDGAWDMLQYVCCRLLAQVLQ